MTTDSSTERMRNTSRWVHPNCFVCSRNNHCGLGLKFELRGDGIVETVFDSSKFMEGYEDILHGGIISSLLDGTMTHRLFAEGVVGLTAELLVRFRHKVSTASPLTIQGWITHHSFPLFILKSRILQNDTVKATAQGKFMAEQTETERF